MTNNEFRRNLELERQMLTNVELPNLIHRILKLNMFPKTKEITELYVEQIKKITNTECESALSYFEND